ncbi:MAG TPA: hypothetical protein VFQ51_20040 [Vicinamibacteria bacterium]|nr:hypothetical protein [Vicinamibacteria bacterium]
MAAANPVATSVQADRWEECRNNRGIARLLVSERRPEPLVATACRMAVESACRTALQHAGLPWSGDVDAALDRLRIHRVSMEEAPTPRSLLLAAEETVALIAAWLRRQEPNRTWGF